MRRFFASLILCLLVTNAALAENKSIFEQNKALGFWNIQNTSVKTQTLRTYRLNGIEVEEIYYASRPYKNEPVSIFGYYTYPAKSTHKLPAILLVHGGGGGASLNRSLLLAKNGYAVLAIDLPGKGEKRIYSRSTGPDMDVVNLLNAKPPFENNYLVNAVAATRNAITYLSQRKEVDPNRIGMVGLSWGGVITLLTNGQDQRLKAAVNVFGAGYIPEGCTWQDWFDKMSSQETSNWNNLLDPKNFLSTQNAPILFLTGTNDHCYYLPTFQKSYFQVNAEKNLCLIPNLRHQFFMAEQKIVERWLDIYLKEGGGFPSISVAPVGQMKNKVVLSANIAASGEARIVKVNLYYSNDSPSLWTKKRWYSIPGKLQQGKYSFSIPNYYMNPEILFFVSATDSKGGITSTPVRSIIKVKLPNKQQTYALTAPLSSYYQHSPPFELFNSTEAIASTQTASKIKPINFNKTEKIFELK